MGSRWRARALVASTGLPAWGYLVVFRAARMGVVAAVLPRLALETLGHPQDFVVLVEA